jgi:hypothetical protein
VLNISTVRNAMAAQIGAACYPPLRSLPDIEDQINPPVGIVLPGRPYVNYGVTLEGATGFLGDPALGQTVSPNEFALDYVIVLAKASTIERVEANLDLWLGMEQDGTAVSVAAAVAADPSLGGTVDWCVPSTADPPGPIEWSGLQYFGTRIHFTLSVS